MTTEDDLLTYADLHSGMVIETFLFGAWRSARAEYDHEMMTYVLWLFDAGQHIGFLLVMPATHMRRPGP